MKKWNKTVLTVLLQWDYGRKDQGISGDKLWFHDALEKLVDRVETIWYDDYLQDLPRLQKVLIERAEEIKPDLIFFIPFERQFTLEALDKLRESFPTFAWFGDDTWRFDNFSSWLAPHFSHVSTTDLMSIEKYKRIGVTPILSEWATAVPVSANIGPLGNDESYSYDVSFVGGMNQSRSWFIDRLAKLGIKVECFGAGWPNGRLSFEEMEQLFRKSRINLNLSNSISHDIRFVLASIRNLKSYRRGSKRAEQVKARNFEIPAAGGFQLSNYVIGLERHLVIGQEIAVYTTPEDCAQQIHYYLANEELRQEIIRKSHERALNEHTYQHRLESILKEIWG